MSLPKTEHEQSESNHLVPDFHIHSMDKVDDVTSRKLSYVMSLLSHRQPDVPVVVIDVTVIQELYKKWKKLMPRVEPFYAVKAHPDPRLISELVKVGACFECASLQEINDVLKAGAHPSNIIFGNPTKIPSHITEAASKGVDHMVFDCEGEVEKLKQFHPNCKAVLRLYNNCDSALYKLTAKYGALKEEIPNILRKALEANIEVVGISFHVGTNSQDANVFRVALEEVQDIFKMAAKDMQMRFTLVDVGGGFPGNRYDTPTIENFAIEINREVDRLFPQSNIKIISEPGTYYAGTTTAILLQILTKRIRRQGGEDNQPNNTKIIHYYVNDGLFGNLQTLTVQPFALEKCTFLTKSKLDVDVKFSSVIWGPTMDSVDVLSTNVMWPDLNQGDYVFLGTVGSYGPACATNFNGFGAGITEKYYISTE